MASQELHLADGGDVAQQHPTSMPPSYTAPPTEGQQLVQQQQQQPQQQQTPQPASSPNPASPSPAHLDKAPLNGYYANPQPGAPYGQTPAGAKPMGALAFPVATPLMRLGTHPQPVDCPFCGVRTLTTIKEEPSTMTHVTALLCCLLCVCLVCVPYATNMACDVEHRCGSCRKMLAIARNGGGVDVVAYVPAQAVNTQPAKEPQPAAQPQVQPQEQQQPLAQPGEQIQGEVQNPAQVYTPPEPQQKAA